MAPRPSWFFVGFLILIIAVLAFLMGKGRASKTVDSMVMNNVLIQQIAELSSLEARGNASIKSTNIADDGSLTDYLKKVFIERTVNITVPYVAKYGIDLNNQKITIEEENKQVYIVLPHPKLLSYELRLDKANAVSRKGLFESDNEEAYNKVMQKLYAQTREQLEKNTTFREQSKEKIRKIINDYYAPLNMKVHISFSDEIKSKVLEQTPQ